MQKQNTKLLCSRNQLNKESAICEKAAFFKLHSLIQSLLVAAEKLPLASLNFRLSLFKSLHCFS